VLAKGYTAGRKGKTRSRAKPFSRELTRMPRINHKGHEGAQRKSKTKDKIKAKTEPFSREFQAAQQAATKTFTAGDAESAGGAGKTTAGLIFEGHPSLRAGKIPVDHDTKEKHGIRRGS
jgi:hypothetical protein